MSEKKFYLTTPIYYVNARPHIGHAYTTIVADVLARRHRLLGEDTFFLTGTDEHGQKIERSAAAAGLAPQQFADQVSASFEALWHRMGITNDDYIRTTDAKHKRGVQKLFTDLYENGFIYLDTYTGAYCVSDEAFVDVPAGTPCPDCGRITETVTEQNFFFKLSAFQRPLLDLIESDTLKIQNDSRRNEVLSFLLGPVVKLEREGFVLVPQMSAAARDLDRATTVSEFVKVEELSYTAIGTPYVAGALNDLSVSRSSFTWGIPVPSSVSESLADVVKQKHVIYVWLDALANYMTAIGYGSKDPKEQAEFKNFWPADLHLVGKEIIRFHCVYWPAFLLALNPALRQDPANIGKRQQDKFTFRLVPDPNTVPFDIHKAWAAKMLPRAITAHGWLLFEDSKMSKSKGNIVRTETILDAFGNEVYGKQFPESSKHERDLFASDVLRYFLLREIPFGQDGSFSFDALITRYNADLANGYGNLVSRTLSMIDKYFASAVPECFETQAGTFYIEPRKESFLRPEQHETLGATEGQILGWSLIRISEKVEDLIASNSFDQALAAIASGVTHVDQFITSRKPWAATETEISQEGRRSTLYTAAESIRIITALLYPILPNATAKVWAQLGLGDIELAARNGELNNLEWGGLKPGTKLGPLGPIFPRADKGLAQIMIDIENPTPATTLTTENGQLTTTTPEAAPEATPPITIDDFAKIELRVAQILVAERIPKADKLLRLEVDLGPDFPRRQILSGIAEWYAPEDLIGRRIVVITNLAPRKMRGLESHGMLLAASHGENGKPVLATFSEDIALGSRLK